MAWVDLRVAPLARGREPSVAQRYRGRAGDILSLDSAKLPALAVLSLALQYGVAPISNRDAFKYLEALMQRPNVRFVDEPPGIMARWKTCADLPSASPKRWMDAYLAAFAIEAGLSLVSGDSDFKVFLPELKLVSVP